jgi:hypothetical protein
VSRDRDVKRTILFGVNIWDLVPYSSCARAHYHDLDGKRIASAVYELATEFR